MSSSTSVRSASLALSYLLVALGGVVGAGTRWAVIEVLGSEESDQVGLLVANVLGCLVIGVLVGRSVRERMPHVWLVAAVGWCGGLTSFSSFALDIATTMNADVSEGLLGGSVVSVLLIASAVLGRRLGQRFVNA